MSRRRKQQIEDCPDRRENCGKFSWCVDCCHNEQPKNPIDWWDYDEFRKDYEQYMEEFYGE